MFKRTQSPFEQLSTGAAIGAYDLTKSFNGQPIVRGVSLEVERGEIALITGESGSGKSTVMRMIAGIDRPDSGRTKIVGQDVYELSQRQRTRLIAGRVAVGFQAPNLDTNMSVFENLIGLSEARGQEPDMAAAARLVTRFGFDGALDKKASVLSGGEKLKLAFGRIMLSKPDVLLLDEPTYALDHENKEYMFDDIAVACRDEGVTALIVTHDLAPARAIADREFIMGSGELIDERQYSYPIGA